VGSEQDDVAALVVQLKDALAQRGIRDEDHLVPFGDGHLHSVEEVITFIDAADVDDRAWVQVTGFFHRLGDLDSRWSSIQRVGDSTQDPDKLAQLAVYAFEAIIERTRDELEARLEVACQSTSVRKMLSCCDVSARYVELIERYAEPLES
jgi:hypothetical protein